MFRLTRSVLRTRLTAVAAIAGCAAILSGCGNSQVDTSAQPVMPAAQTPNVAASGPAISQDLTFDQLALESPAKRTTNKNGLVFLSFKYADNDGKIYKCELPEAMSKGTYSPQQWVRTFAIYKLPQVVGQKKVGKGRSKNLGDFPFISPKPQPVPKAPSQEPKPQINVPQLPPMPTQSAPSTPVPGGPPAMPGPEPVQVKG